MAKRDEALFTRLRVKNCPKCKTTFSKQLEPYLGVGDDTSSPIIGIKCPSCGHQVEWIMPKILPLRTDLFHASMGACCQLVMVQFMTGKTIEMGNVNDFEKMNKLVAGLERLKDMLGEDCVEEDTNAKS